VTGAAATAARQKCKPMHGLSIAIGWESCCIRNMVLAAQDGESKRLPGRGAKGHDVYVARWREDLKGLAWLWVLEQHGRAGAVL